MQRNLDNFSFLLKPSENFVDIIINKNEFLKVGFVRTVTSRHENPTISEHFTKTNQKRSRLEWKRILGICDVKFGELVGEAHQI